MQLAKVLFCILLTQSLAARVRQSAVKKAVKSGAVAADKQETDEKSPPTGMVDWLLSDMIEIDARAAEEKLRSNTNILMDPLKEHVVFAFKCGNDKTYFTNHRILLRPKGWLVSWSTKYESVTYKSIAMYGMQTAGIFPDMDTDLWFYTKMPALPYFSMEFRKGGEHHADIYKILAFLNEMLLGPDSTGSSFLEEGTTNPFTDVFHWLANNAAEVDAGHVEQLFKKSFPVLQQDETVLKAFMVGRDRTILTNKRLMRIDVTGITGKQVEYESYPWSSVQAFATETSGYFDGDSIMNIWTNIPYRGKRKFSQDLRGFGAGTPDVDEIQEIFAKHVLGDVETERVTDITPVAPGHQGGANEFLAFLGGDHIEMGATKAEARLRGIAPLILRPNEHVERAFMKSRYEKDVVYLTTRRILIADVHKFFGFDDRIQYMSLPYSSVLGYEVETAAALDFDSRFSIYTGIMNPPPTPHCTTHRKQGNGNGNDEKDNGNGNGNGGTQTYDRRRDSSRRERGRREKQDSGSFVDLGPAPQGGKKGNSSKGGGSELEETCTYIETPGKSKIDFELQAGTDLDALQKLLYAKLVKGLSHPPLDLIPNEEHAPSLWNPVNLIHWLDGNNKEISPAIASKMLWESGPFLQDGEEIHKAFTTWRDVTLLTSSRILFVDIQSVWPLQTVIYKSVPYTSVHGFGVRTSGTFDLDAEMMFYTTMPWYPKIQHDLAAGTSNIAEIQQLMTNKVLASSSSALLQTQEGEQPGPIGNFLDWLGSNAGKIDVADATRQLQTQPPILRAGEEVKLAYKVGYDLTCFTNERILYADVNDWDLLTRKVEYRTIPYSSILGFTVETATNYFDRDEEISVNTDMHSFSKFEQDVVSGQGDIFDVQKLLAQKVL